MFCLSAGPVNAMRQLPPYLPTSFVGCSTSGSCGRRCSTGGSLPAFTCSASIGASLNCFGVLEASVITCGRLPLAAGAVVVELVAVAATADRGASAGVWAAAGGAAVGAVIGGASRPH